MVLRAPTEVTASRCCDTREMLLGSRGDQVSTQKRNTLRVPAKTQPAEENPVLKTEVRRLQQGRFLFAFPVFTLRYHSQPLLETGHWAARELGLTQDSCFDELPGHIKGSASSSLNWEWFRLLAQLLEREMSLIEKLIWDSSFLHSVYKDQFLRVPVLCRMNLCPDILFCLTVKMRQ